MKRNRQSRAVHRSLNGRRRVGPRGQGMHMLIIANVMAPADLASRSDYIKCREMIKVARLLSRGNCLCRLQALRNSHRPYHTCRTIQTSVPQASSGHCKHISAPNPSILTIRRATSCRVATMEADTSASTNPLLAVCRPLHDS